MNHELSDEYLERLLSSALREEADEVTERRLSPGRVPQPAVTRLSGWRVGRPWLPMVAVAAGVIVVAASAVVVPGLVRGAAPVPGTSPSTVSSGAATSPRPAPTASPSGVLQTSPSPSGAATPTTSPGWLNRGYPVDCGRVRTGVAFLDGKATVDGMHLTVNARRYTLRDQQSGKSVAVEAVTVGCVGADTWPDTVLVYRADGDQALLGTALPAGSGGSVQSMAVANGQLVVRALAWSTTAPHAAPDLTLVATSGVTGAGLRRTVSVNLATPDAKAQYLYLGLPLTSEPGDRAVAFTAEILGQVPVPVSAVSGAQLPVAGLEVQGTRVDWGDGTSPDGSDAGDATCKAGTAVAALKNSFEEKHTYAKPGTYTITFTTRVCGTVGEVIRTLEVQVR